MASQQTPDLQLNQVTDIDTIKLTTLSLNNELQDMRKLLKEMHNGSNKKEAEILRLNKILTEKTKTETQSSLQMDEGKQQLQEENEQLLMENKQMRKKIETQKK